MSDPVSGPTGAKRAFRLLLIAFAILVASVALLLLMFAQEILRVRAVLTLFDEDRIVENFLAMDAVLEVQRFDASDDVCEFERGEASLPEVFVYGGEEISVAQFIDDTDTTGLLVVHDDTIVFEEYYRGHDENTPHISWSVAKSFTSAMVGIAIEQGHIESIQDPVTKYIPALRGSGYDGVSIKDILQMSSGVAFNEDYADFNSDINRMGRMLALNTSIDDFVASIKPGRPAGEVNHYVSMDTQVLGMVLREATGEKVTDYMQRNLWDPIGMESGGYWLVDVNGTELVFGGLNAVLRDYARFGRLYMNGGARDGKQIVPADWVRASVTPDAPHLQPGENDLSDFRLGYGYQWWLPENPEGDFLAIGVYGQFIYVHPGLRVVIAKNSAYVDYNIDGDEMEYASVEFFRAIARQVAAERGD